jgi:hypothetical protein
MSVDEDLLVADFNQCFEQMRHYDESFRRSLEFSGAGIASVITASGALFGQYGVTPLTTKLVAALLLFSSFVSLMLVVLMARNRVYFAVVARFVNEVRGLYASRSPGGFSNAAGMYCDHRFPKIFSAGSTQSVQLYFLLVCNSALFATAIILFNESFQLAQSKPLRLRWIESTSAALVFFLGELGWLLTYWHRRHRRRTATTAVFGR